MENNIYTPFTEEEYKEILNVVGNIRDIIPADKADWVWNQFCKLKGGNWGVPSKTCNCSAGEWRKAVTELREYLTKVEENGNNRLN